MEYELYSTTDGELTHWGIKGMRWGIRRYQNKDGSLTPAGKKRYDAEMEKIKAETKKLKAQQRAQKSTATKLKKLDDAKKELESLKKGKKTDQKDDVETDEQKRERILKNPDAKSVYENRHLFSNKEVGELQLRLIQEENIKKLVPKEGDPRQEKADKFIKNVEDVTAKAISLGKAYNLAATVYNAFSGTNSVSLPKLDLDSLNKGNKKDRQEEKKALKEAANKAKKAEKEAAAAKKAQDKADKAKAAAAKADKADAKAKDKAEKAAEKAQAKADRAAAKAQKEYEEYNKKYTSEPDYDSSSFFSPSSYRSTGGSRDYVNPSESRGLSVTNKSSYSSKTNKSSSNTSGNRLISAAASSVGRAAASSVMSNLPAVVSKVPSTTTSRGESAVAGLLTSGGSTSTRTFLGNVDGVNFYTTDK